MRREPEGRKRERKQRLLRRPWAIRKLPYDSDALLMGHPGEPAQPGS